jgi:hypothetical protein
MQARSSPSRAQKEALSGLDNIFDVETRLVARPQPTCGRPEAPRTLFTLNHVTRLGQCSCKTKHRGIVQTGPPADFRQTEMALAKTKSFQDSH